MTSIRDFCMLKELFRICRQKDMLSSMFSLNLIIISTAIISYK